MSLRTPRGMRLHIGLFGRRNAGKSSLLNAMTRQYTSIVSNEPGTTTDPVEKAMELLPLGPVLFIDTAGIDDSGSLGELRVERTHAIFDRTDLGVVVASAGAWGAPEEFLCKELAARQIPVIAVINKIDLAGPDRCLQDHLSSRGIKVVLTSLLTKSGILDFRQAILDQAPASCWENPAILSDLVNPGDCVVLVVPIDKEAPRGRLILPQVQSIRDLLDGDTFCLVTQDNRLANALAQLRQPPALVVTDSQAFAEVARLTPRSVPMTSFSILFSRYKGDLEAQTRGTVMIDSLQPGDHILVAEHCTHHPIADDIGREKIPAWLRHHVNGPLTFTHVQGHDFPTDLSPYNLIVHCGACTANRREITSRIRTCEQAGVPVTNYGLCIAHSLGILDRALEPFPVAREIYRARHRPVTIED